MPNVTKARTRYLAAMVATMMVAVTVLILAPPAWAAPANDNLRDAIVISGERADVTGSNVGATHLSGEPNHGGGSGTASVWYKWTPAATSWTTIDTCGTSFDNVLAVYTGPNVVSLTSVASSNASGEPHRCAPSPHGAVHFLATGGVAYNIVVDSRSGGVAGDFELHLNPPPASDAFGQARVVHTGNDLTPPTSTVTTGWSRFATEEAGEPAHAGSGSASVWLDWVAPGTGTVTMDTCGSDFDTVLAAYAGTSLEDLTELGSNDDDPVATCGTQSRMSFAAAIGQHYRVAVAGKGGAAGEFIFHVDSSALVLPNDDFADAKELTGTSVRDASHNGFATEEPGENLWFDDATGGRTIWYRWTAPTSEPYDVDLCDPGTPQSLRTVLGVYTGSSLATLAPVGTSSYAKGTGRCAHTDISAVIFEAVAGATYSIQVGATRLFNSYTFPAFFGPLVTSIERANRPANDDSEFLRVLSGASAQVTQSTAGASAEPSEPAHAGSPATASVWFDWTARASSEVRITTCGSDFDTRLALYRGRIANFVDGVLSQLVPVISNDDGGAACPPGPTAGAVAFTATAGTTYRIAVDGKAGATGSLTLGIEQGPAPSTGWQRIGPVHDVIDTFILASQATVLPGGDRLLWWNQADITATDVWTSARRVRADGTMGPLVDLTTATEGAALADLAALPDGRIAGFAARYEGQDSYLEARIFNADLTPAGPPVPLAGPMLLPLGRQVVAAPDGTLTFSWIASTTIDVFGRPVLFQARARQLTSAGTLGPLLDLSTYGEDAYGNVSVGVAADGTVTAAWQVRDTDGVQRVDARRITPAGAAGPAVTVDATGWYPQVGVAADGSALITWLGDDVNAAAAPLTAARMTPDGMLSTPVQLQEDGPTSQVTEHEVAVSSTGRFFVTWLRQFDEAGAIAKQVQGRFVEADGSAGPLLGLSTPSLSDAFFFSNAAAAFDRWGNVTTSWTTLADDADVSASQARRVAPNGMLGPIADLSHWPENAGATDLVVDPSGVPLAAQVRVELFDANASSFRVTVEAEELAVADLTVTGAGTGARSATFTVANEGPRASVGDAERPITATLAPPAGLSVSAASGTGWSCTTGATATCTRTGSVAAGTSAPPIAVAYGTGAAPTTPAGATVTAGLTTDPNPANDATTTLLVPMCDGKAATRWGSGTLTGTSGDDVIVGSAGNDTIDGAGGNDTICAGAGTDTVKGGNGNDTLVEADDTGADVLDGGNGTDTVTYRGRTTGVSVTLDGVANDGIAGEADNVKATEVVVGTDAADVLTGGNGADRLVGLGGDDRLDGGGGTDTLAGGAGNDTVLGGRGNDTIDESDGTGADVLDGGSGADSITYLGRPAGVDVSLDGAANDGTAGEGDNVKGVESVTGTDQADLITGSAGSDLLFGMGGNDTLRGLGGNDVLNGGAGNDVLDGGPGVDVAVFDLGDTLVNIP